MFIGLALKVGLAVVVFTSDFGIEKLLCEEPKLSDPSGGKLVGDFVTVTGV